MSKVSILAKNVPFETVLIVFLFCDVSQCCEEFVLHNRNLVYRVPLCYFYLFIYLGMHALLFWAGIPVSLHKCYFALNNHITWNFSTVNTTKFPKLQED